MPIYDFQCSSCGFKKELMRKISAPAVIACPECGQETFSKQVSAPSFQLTGSGWYATDFKGGSKAPASTGADSDKTASESSSNSTGAACNPGCACH